MFAPFADARREYMSSRRHNGGGNNKLLSTDNNAGTRNSLPNCFAAAFLLPQEDNNNNYNNNNNNNNDLHDDEHNDTERILDAHQAIQRVVTITEAAARSNALDAILGRASAVVDAPNLQPSLRKNNQSLSTSSRRLSISCQTSSSDFGDLNDFGLSDIDDSSTAFKLMEDALRWEEDSDVDNNNDDEISILSFSSNVKSEKSPVKDSRLLLAGARKRKKLVRPARKKKRKINIFHRRWLAAATQGIPVTKTRHKKSKRDIHGNTGEGIEYPVSHSTLSIKGPLNVQQNCIWSRLCLAMARSCSTQVALQDWDRMNGLPASHARSMLKSSRSRKMLQEYIKLLKAQGIDM